MLQEALFGLLEMDTTTLMSILIWGNFLSPVFIYTYRTLAENAGNKNTLTGMVLIRYLHAIAYLLILFRGILPDSISVILGNILLFIVTYCDTALIMKISNLLNKKLMTIMSCLLVADIILFCLIEFLFAAPALRVPAASVVLFSLYLIPTLSLLFKKNIGSFRRSIGVFYGILLIALVYRFFASIHTDTPVLSNSLSQSIFFLSQIMVMISSIILQLLLIKEDNDNELHLLATTDYLTGLSNRRYFMAQAELIFESCRQKQQEITIMFLDIDFFKAANDTYGHQFGDEVLISFANTLKSNLRCSDISCRYGGEEFVLLLPGTGDYSRQIALRILEKTQQISFPAVPDFTFTTSIGIASGIPAEQEQLIDFIRHADTAMYDAKQHGRNKLVVYEKSVSG
mgnify:CR=1 FL=1